MKSGLTLVLALMAAHAQAQTSPAIPHLARSLAATCATCHGITGQARGDMPSLAGVSADLTISRMADFKSGARSATVMHQIAKGYTDEQIRLIAAYFAAQPRQ